MSDIQLFDFQGNDVRTATHDDGSLWFVGVDICNVLGHSNSSVALSRLDEDEKSGVNIADPHGREQVTTLISESGMWKLVLTSRLPSAHAFRQWLTREVLPSIRKTGAYSVESQPTLSPTMQAKAMIEEELAIDALFELPKYITLTESVKRVRVEIGLDLSHKLLASPVMDNVPEEDIMLEPSEIARRLDIPVRRINPLLESLGVQAKKEGVWTPAQDVMDKGMAAWHQWTKAGKSGFNLKWNLNYIKTLVGK